MSTTPTPEAPSPELIRMHNAGQLLANCAFNIAQHAGEPVSESVAATLKQCQNEWDAACLAFKTARAALTQGAGEAVEPVAWLSLDGVGDPNEALFTAQQLQQAVAREREECAVICERAVDSIWEYHEDNHKRTGRNVCTNLAAAIRAKGTHD